MAKSGFGDPGPNFPVGRYAAVLTFLFIVFCAADIASARTLAIGSISLDPVGETRVYQPFADYLADKLGAYGIEDGKVVVADSIAAMAAMLRRKEVDIYIDSSVTALMVNELAGSKFLLRRWKDGHDAYRGVVVVRRESPIASLGDLSGGTVALEEPFSTSGFLLPALAIAGRGLPLVPLRNTGQSPPPGSVGYVLGFDSETQMAWVERRQVTAAAMAEEDYKALSDSALTPLRVLYTSPPVPYHVVVHGAHMDVRTLSRIREVLLNAHDSQTGAEMLDGFDRTTMFDEIPGDLLGNVMSLVPGLMRLLETGN